VASVLLLPLGLLLGRDSEGRIAPAPLAVALLVLAVVVLRRDGRRWWTVGTAACTIELAGVLAIGAWSLSTRPASRRRSGRARQRLRLPPAGLAAARPALPTRPAA
jgi:hypothetical protein